ncbi:MAG TPA: hypothetical protein VF794_14370 [Archangium sp.]|jgi:hypothetical protein|uniref:hypothetical protein n=1 Tax=Archangium sp. TaxID=1872627 RepID=UPI002ED88E70
MKTPAPISVDDSLWPLVVIRFVGTPSLRAFEAHLEQRAELLRRGEPHLLLMDASRSGLLPTEHRQRQAAWTAQHDEALRSTVLGTAWVTDSAFLQLSLRSLFHLEPPTHPYVLVPTVEQAADWAARQLEAARQHEAATRVRAHFALRSERPTG